MAEPAKDRHADEDLSTIRQMPDDSTGPAAPSSYTPATEGRPAHTAAPEPSDAASTLRRDPAPDTASTLRHGPSDTLASTEGTSPERNDRLSSTIDASELDGCAPGQVLFDRYVVERQIGSGGMGTVWLVKHKTLGVRRALKLIRPQIAFDPKTRADFRREAMIMANLHHPNAVMVHDARIGTDLAYIEMEYLEGSSVEKRLEPGEPMPLDWVVRILDQLCQLLAFVHEKGIVHRDLKPSNLLLLDGHPPGHEFLKVLDFGIAKSFNPDLSDPDTIKTRTGGALFTPHYASPEQVGGAKETDARSDLYSVGVILYEFLTGYRPFSEPGLVYQHLCVPAPAFKQRNPKSTVPPEVERVVMSCLEKDPKQRPRTAAELADRFREAVESTGLAPTAVDTVRKIRTVGKDVSALKPEGIGDFSGGTDRKIPKPVVAALVLLGLVGILWIVSNVLRRPDADLRPTLSGNGGGGTAAGPDSRPTKSTSVPRVELAFGFAADPDAKHSPTGWPMEIVESSTGDRFVRFADGIYIPDLYDPEDPKDLVGEWPRALIRRGAGGGRFVRIEGGTFVMGGLLPPDAVKPNGDVRPDLPTRRVTLPDYYIQDAEVTNLQMEQFRASQAVPRPEAWNTFADAMGADGRQRLSKRAATFVNRVDAAQYARHVKGRLPTEAEWEYAARSRGKGNLYPWGAAVADAELTNINNAAIIGGSVIPIAEPGAFSRDRTEQGLADMAGNVREWCFDVFAPYLAKDVVQPANPELLLDAKLNYVVRGSSYYYDADRASTTARTFEVGSQTAADLGFRVVLRVPSAMK